jgi:exosortase
LNLKISSIIKVAIIVILVAFIFWPTFGWLKDRYTEADTYYSHGFLIPWVSLFLIYRRRKELISTPQLNNVAGIFLVAFGLLVHLVALRWGVNFISGFSLIVVLFGLFLALWGVEATRKNTFPLSFLVFMIPLPKVAIISISFKLKIMAAQLSTNIINAFGIPALRQGSIVQLPNTALTIGDPCSGLRSLISLLALGALYAYLSKLNRIKKVILFLSAVPIAIIANIVRIVLLLLVAYVYGSEVATGKFHDFSGLLVFVIALIGLMIIGRFLLWRKSS